VVKKKGRKNELSLAKVSFVFANVMGTAPLTVMAAI
jgi:hypothetical protein